MQVMLSHMRTAALLSTAVLAMPCLAWGLELRPALMPVFWTLAIVSVYLVATWPLRTAGHWLVKTLAALALLGAGGLMLGTLMLVNLLSHTDRSVPLADGCRVDAERVGGFGDTDLNVRYRCPVALLWTRSTLLLWDTEAVVSQLHAATPAADGAAQVALTLGRYGKPGEQHMLRIPPQ
jgi:hypothetical protein